MKKVFKSNKKGAVIIARSSFSSCTYMYNAKIGIRKFRGCHYYRHADGSVGMYLLGSTCKRKYLDVPGLGEAWLVYSFKNGNGYHWELIEIGFS